MAFFEAFNSFCDSCKQFLDQGEICVSAGFPCMDWVIVLFEELLDGGIGDEGLKVRLNFSLPFGW